MILILIILVLVAWLFFMGFKFYRRMDWEEPAEYTPDFGQMRKREAELLHVQDVLADAVREGKLAPHALEEVQRFADAEIAAMDTLRRQWQDKRQKR